MAITCKQYEQPNSNSKSFFKNFLYSIYLGCENLTQHVEFLKF